MLDKITPVLLTYNEAPNIGRALERLAWAKRIIIIDSGSTDATLDIVARHPLAETIYRSFDDFASQCNFGLLHVATEWVLSLDADYMLSDDLIQELSTLSPDDRAAGFQARFVYCVHGKPLRGTLYPPRTVLYQKNRALYRNEGHAHRVVIDGPVQSLAAPIFHDDRKPLSRWFLSQKKYARVEAQHLLTSPRNTLRRADRVRLMAWPAPILVFLHTLLMKRCILDGWQGWLYVLQRTLAELMLAIEILDRRLSERTTLG